VLLAIEAHLSVRLPSPAGAYFRLSILLKKSPYEVLEIRLGDIMQDLLNQLDLLLRDEEKSSPREISLADPLRHYQTAGTLFPSRH
jgi:hypothetical protein